MFIKNRIPLGAAVRGFPDTSRGSTDLDDIRVVVYRIYGGDPAAHSGRADIAGFPGLEMGVEIHLLGLGQAG